MFEEGTTSAPKETMAHTRPRLMRILLRIVDEGEGIMPSVSEGAFISGGLNRWEMRGQWNREKGIILGTAVRHEHILANGMSEMGIG